MVWKTKQQEAFEAAKCLLSQDTALAHCDLKRALKLYCDASAYGLGVCLVHIMDDNSEKQVAYALCTLTKSEMAYAQIERKGLVLVHIWHLPLAWMPFCISVTVHRPLSVRYVFVSKTVLQPWPHAVVMPKLMYLKRPQCVFIMSIMTDTLS